MLDASNALENDYSPLVVSAGAAYVFWYNGASWVEDTKLSASDGSALDQFGYALALEENMLAIGAPWNGGAVYIFRYEESSWIEGNKLITSGPLGLYVALSGDTVAAGSPRPGDYGAAYVYSALAVPEPSKLILSMASLAALVAVSRERRV